MGETCPRNGASGVIRLLYYVVYRSPRYFPFSPYLSGQQVSTVRMRGAAALEVDWSSEEAPALAEPPLNLVL